MNRKGKTVDARKVKKKNQWVWRVYREELVYHDIGVRYRCILLDYIIVY